MQWDSAQALKKKKKKEIVTCYNVDEPRGHYVTLNKPVTERQILCESTYVRYLK